MRGAEAWAALQEALKDNTPACEDNELFITDWFPSEATKAFCKSCPVYDQCKKYATTAKPLGGIWAGMRFNTKGQLISYDRQERTQHKTKTPKS